MHSDNTTNFCREPSCDAGEKQPWTNVATSLIFKTLVSIGETIERRIWDWFYSSIGHLLDDVFLLLKKTTIHFVFTSGAFLSCLLSCLNFAGLVRFK